MMTDNKTNTWCQGERQAASIVLFGGFYYEQALNEHYCTRRYAPGIGLQALLPTRRPRLIITFTAVRQAAPV